LAWQLACTAPASRIKHRSDIIKAETNNIRIAAINRANKPCRQPLNGITASLALPIAPINIMINIQLRKPPETTWLVTSR
jgi:hypothetical protein